MMVATDGVREEDIRAALAARAARELPLGACKSAAVLVPLLPGPSGWKILLTRRTSTVEHHRGEISFPGGHAEPADPDLFHTALRESAEEVGITADRVRLLGRLDDIYTITRFRVSPFVGRVEPTEFKAEPGEIDELILLPLGGFLQPGCFAEYVLDRGAGPYAIYFFQVNGYTVWGATAKILKQFLELCLGFRPEGEPGPEVRAALAATLAQFSKRT